MLNGQRGIKRNFFTGKKLIFILIILVAISIFLISTYSSNKPLTAVPTCGDGTFYSTCSLDKPYYCNDGTLIENVSACTCPSQLSQSGNSCVSIYQSGQESSAFNYVLNGQNGSINVSLYKGLTTYLSILPKAINYNNGQPPMRADFKLLRINEPNQEVLIQPLIKEIQNLAPDDKVTQARIAISLVQNIPWGTSGKEVTFGGQTIVNSRYPYEVLYDNQGLCGEKSELLAKLLKDIGYGVALFYYPTENHETLGIKCPIEESLNGTGYCFVETSGSSIISDSSLIYSGGVMLSSSPEVILISNGISLPSGLPEYHDADVLASLRSKGSLGPINSYTFRQLENKYGLSKVYNID
jgi:hypothetical protein